MYKIVFEKPALKFLKKQPREVQERLLKAISKIPDGDIKKLQGNRDWYRLRVGDYRVVYSIDNEVLLICIINIGSRGQIYKDI